MSTNIKIIGYPRTGNQYCLSIVFEMCDLPAYTSKMVATGIPAPEIVVPRSGIPALDNWYANQQCIRVVPTYDVAVPMMYEDFLTNFHSHDHEMHLRINHPVIYICRNPLETVYSRVTADNQWHKTNQQRSMPMENDPSFISGDPAIQPYRSEEEDIYYRMKEYRNHLQKYYKKPNLIVSYKEMMLNPVITFDKVFNFLEFDYNKGQLAEMISNWNKESVIARVMPINPGYYNKFLLLDTYAENRQKFIEKHRDEFLEYFKDYPELFE